jgi:hypothetical protein
MMDAVLQAVVLVLLLAATLGREVGGPVLGVDGLVPAGDHGPPGWVPCPCQALDVGTVECRAAVVVTVGLRALRAVAQHDVAHVSDQGAEAGLARA